jgi:acyl-CoA thioester hydrolase
VIVPFDFETQRPRRITAEEREFLEEYRDDDEDEAVAA